MKPKATDTPGGFIFRCDWAAALLEMPPELRLKINDAIFRYVLSGEEPTDPAVKFSMFPLIKAELDRNAEKYADVCEKRREAGRRGGKKGNKTTAPDGVNVGEPTDGSPMDEAEETPETTAPEPQRKAAKARFSPPSVDEVQQYITAQGYSVNAANFVDFYAAKGWRIGNNLMKDWKAAVRTWQRREQQNPTAPTQPNGNTAQFTPNERGEVNVCGIIVKLGYDERIDAGGRRTYGSGRTIVPNDAPPRPANSYEWSNVRNEWVYNTF